MALMEDTTQSKAVLEVDHDHDIVHAHHPIGSHLSFLDIRSDDGDDAVTESVGTEHDLVVDTLPINRDIALKSLSHIALGAGSKALKNSTLRKRNCR